MSDIHQSIFKLYLMELDGRTLNTVQRAELQAHLSACPSCQADVQLYQGLRAQASRRWMSAPAPLSMDNIVQADQSHTRLRYLTLPLRAVFWAGFAVLRSGNGGVDLYQPASRPGCPAGGHLHPASFNPDPHGCSSQQRPNSQGI